MTDTLETILTDEEKPAEPTGQEMKEILESVKIDLNAPEKPKRGRKAKEVIQVDTSNLSEEDKLYSEFSSFLENKAEIYADDGIKQVIPTKIKLLDAVLGGGFAVGAMSIITGQPGSGKSMLAMQTLGAAQEYYKGLLAGYLDSEVATTAVRLSMLGVNKPKIKPYSDITVEKVFKFLEGLCLFKDAKKIIDIPSVVIWDSIANTLSQKEREVEDINQVIGYKARMLSILVPKYAAKMGVYNISLIAVNQLRDTMAMGGFAPAKDLKFMSAGKHMPGGNTLVYNAFTLLEMKTFAVVDPVKYGFEGIIAAVKTVKNKLFSPNITIKLVGSFVTGFSDLWTSFEFLVTTKRLETGAWNYLIKLPQKKFRTKDLPYLYNNDQEFKQMFDKEMDDAIEIDIKKKYDPANGIPTIEEVPEQEEKQEQIIN
jgi:RecA/RadA recombinase